LIELAFTLGRMPDELENCDEVWLNRMLVAQQARILAQRKK
jgi:hypothetical protein